MVLQSEIDKKSQQLDSTISEVEKQKRAINESLLISETNVQGIIVYVNDKFCETSGYAREELIGKTHNIVKSNFHPPSFWQNFWEILKRKETFKGEVCNKRKNGETYWVDTTVYPLLDHNGITKGYSSVRIDITQKKMEQLLLQHNEKLVSIGELAAGVGHEINNPLAIAVGYLSVVKKILTKNLIVNEEVVSKINAIEKSHLRIKKIVDGLRLYSRTVDETSEAISLLNVVVETVDLIKSIYSTNGITVIMEVPTDIDYIVDGNVGKFQQILMNLISNARDATEGRQERIIRVGLIKGEPSEVHLFVQDNGVGIPAHLISKITEPFFTTKRSYKGTGMGLGLVSKFVKEFNGRLEIESQEGVGSTFRVCVPIKSEKLIVSGISA